jgi:NifU-like protein involved in Fe-S cluster formation
MEVSRINIRIICIDIASYLKLPPVKLHCSLLAEDAIKKALDNLKSKSDDAAPNTANVEKKV